MDDQVNIAEWLMELTPAERIKLNAAIVNSVKTGQPLSSFGNLTIPEFGISEAGGLFFR